MDKTEAARAAAFGAPLSLENNEQLRNLSKALDNHQSDRLKSAVTDTIRVFPVAGNIYLVESLTDGELNKYRVSLGRPRSCECEDFVYNCMKHAEVYCKHGWRVRILIREGGIPEPEENPLFWLSKRIENDIEESHSPVIKAKLRELKAEVMTTDLASVDMKTLFQSHAALLSLARAIEQIRVGQFSRV